MQDELRVGRSAVEKTSEALVSEQREKDTLLATLEAQRIAVQHLTAVNKSTKQQLLDLQIANGNDDGMQNNSRHNGESDSNGMQVQWKLKYDDAINERDDALKQVRVLKSQVYATAGAQEELQNRALAAERDKLTVALQNALQSLKALTSKYEIEQNLREETDAKVVILESQVIQLKREKELMSNVMLDSLNKEKEKVSALEGDNILRSIR